MTIEIRENDLKKLVNIAVIDVLKNFKNLRNGKKEEISSPSLSATNPSNHHKHIFSRTLVL